MEVKNDQIQDVELQNIKLDRKGIANFHGQATMDVPHFRTMIAKQDGTTNKILFKSWGGLGDMICGEPVVRYALDHMLDKEISIDAMVPEIFQHLRPRFKNFHDHYRNPANEDQYDVHHLIAGDMNFPWQFICGLFTHCVDFCSLVALRCQLPMRYKEIKLIPNQNNYHNVEQIFKKNNLSIINDINRCILLHPGKHWPSKTFPKWWWDEVISYIFLHNKIPILIGGHKDDANGLRTTVNVDAKICLDLRSKLSVIETVALLKDAKVLLTNDSAPLHMAASTECWIGFIATCKHPDYITHYRHNEFGWRMQNFSRGGFWEIYHELSGGVVVEIEEKLLLKWLPEPEKFAQWAIDKLNRS